jgi:hypothetical protein
MAIAVVEMILIVFPMSPRFKNHNIGILCGFKAESNIEREHLQSSTFLTGEVAICD